MAETASSEQAALSRRRDSEFTATHAVNNALTKTLCNADLLAPDPRLPAELRAAMREVVEGVEEAIEALKQLTAEVQEVAPREVPARTKRVLRRY